MDKIKICPIRKNSCIDDCAWNVGLKCAVAAIADNLDDCSTQISNLDHDYFETAGSYRMGQALLAIENMDTCLVSIEEDLRDLADALNQEGK